MMTSNIGPEVAHAAEVLVKDYTAVTRRDSVLIAADTSSDMTVVEAVLNAADSTGARTVVNVIPPLPFQGALANPYIAEPLAVAMQNCDVLIDLTFPYLGGSRAYDEAMKGGRLRYILCGDLTAAALVRLFGKVDLDRLFAVHKALIGVTSKAVGKTCRITNEAGTDVTFTLAKMPYPKPRQAKLPGLYSVPGAVGFWPEHESVKGRITVDCAFHEYYTKLSSPISLDLAGRIRSVTGGGNERKVMNRALKRAGGGKYGYVIHFSCGIQPAARYTRECFVEDQRVVGNNAVGLGIPFWQPGGGENHPDAVVTMQSIWIDGRQIVDEGTIVGPAKVAKLADGFEPLYN